MCVRYRKMFPCNNQRYDFDSVIEYTPANDDNDDPATEENAPFKIEDIAKVVSALQCQKCNFISKSMDALLEHFKTHSSVPTIFSEDSNSAEEVLVCSICYAQYPSIELLTEHMINTHKLTPIIPQETTANLIAADRYDNGDEDSLVTNMNTDDGTVPVPFNELKMQLMRSFTYKCSIKGCFYKFESREKQEQHMKCHCSIEVEKTREFKCILCTTEIKTWRNCASHMWKEHKIDVDLLKCPICTYKAVTSVKIWRHMRIHAKWRSRVLKKKHQSKENKDKGSTRWYSQKTCDICGRTFANSKTLSKHVKTVHNKIKPFICNVCGRKSARKSTWIVHMRQHTGEKPFQCKTCPFKASDPSVLKQHERRHMNFTRFKCNFCEYSSIQSSSFKNHMKLYHPDEFKNISCDQCHYISVNAAILDAHKKDHKKGLIQNEDSSEAMVTTNTNNSIKNQLPDKPIGNVEISSDCFLPLESTDSIAHDPLMDTGGVTIPAHSEDTQFPNFMHS